MWVDSLNDESRRLAPLYWSKLPPLPIKIQKLLNKYMPQILDVILVGDVLEQLQKISDESIRCIITSPPYYKLRNYNMPGQLGLEKTPELYIDKLVYVFRECKRVLKKDGTLWVNIGDSYASTGKNRTKKQATAKSTLSGSTTSQEQILSQQSKITDGLKEKDLIGIPWMLAFALRADGWYFIK